MNSYSDVKVSGRTNEALSSCCQKKVLYFSDGTLEVDDLDENSTVNSVSFDCKSAAVNPQELTWIPWMLYQTTSAGSKALEVCDYLGESLASFFGITTPKYQFELNEYYRLKREEEEIKKDIEMGDWSSGLPEAENGPVSVGPEAENGPVSVGPKALNREVQT